MKRYRVLVACLQRFHIFYQAIELDKIDFLKLLVQGYPKLITRRWGFSDNKIIFTAFEGIAVRFLKFLPKGLKRELTYYLHKSFDEKVSHSINSDFNFFIGLSSYSIESLRKASQCGVFKIIDHGSLHPYEEELLLRDECNYLGIDFNKLNTQDNRLINRQINEFELSDQIMVLSKIAKNSLIKFGIPSDKIFVNQCGVDLNKFRCISSSNEKFRIIFCGAVEIHKGVHFLIRAFSDLKLKNAELIIIGKSTNKNYLSHLYKLNLRNVRFLGHVEQSKLVNIYSQGSLFVLPSLYDGFGMVVPQAMACGLPIIVSSNVGASDIVEDGINGLIFKNRDIEALKNMMLKVYEDVDLQKSMSMQSLISAKANLSWSHYGERLAANLVSMKY